MDWPSRSGHDQGKGQILLVGLSPPWQAGEGPVFPYQGPLEDQGHPRALRSYSRSVRHDLDEGDLKDQVFPRKGVVQVHGHHVV